MRISSHILVQKITDDEVVIINEITGEEINFIEEEARRIAAAFIYFFPNTMIPETVQPFIEEAPHGL